MKRNTVQRGAWLAMFSLAASLQLTLGYYDPGIQRWINRDPIGERGGINLSDFVNNSPVNSSDPNGLTLTGAIIGGTVGGAVGGWVGGTIGAGSGIVIGGTGGTVVEPGGGTIVGGVGGGITGAEIGAGAGAVAGFCVGALFGDWLSNHMARHESGQRNYLNDKAANIAKETGKDQCEVLEAMMKAAKAAGDTARQRDIKQAQKSAGCRHHN